MRFMTAEESVARPNRRRLPWSFFNLFIKGGEELRATLGCEIDYVYSNYYFSADQVAKYLHFNRNKPKKDIFDLSELADAPTKKSIFYLQRKKLESQSSPATLITHGSASPSKKSTSKADMDRPGNLYKPKTLQFLIDGFSRPKSSKISCTSQTSLFEDESTETTARNSPVKAESFELTVNIYDHRQNSVAPQYPALDSTLKSSEISNNPSSTKRPTAAISSEKEIIQQSELRELKLAPFRCRSEQESPLSKARPLSRNETVTSSCALLKLTEDVHRGKTSKMGLSSSNNQPALKRKQSAYSRLNRTEKTSFISPGVSSIIKRYADLATQALQIPSPSKDSPSPQKQISPTTSKTFFASNRYCDTSSEIFQVPSKARAGMTEPFGSVLQCSQQSSLLQPVASSQLYFSSTLRRLKRS